MTHIGIDSAVQNDIYRLLAGILNIGNMEFTESDTEEDCVSGVSPASEKFLLTASELLGVGSEDLLSSITKKNMYVSGSTIVKMQSHAQVQHLIVFNYHYACCFFFLHNKYINEINWSL